MILGLDAQITGQRSHDHDKEGSIDPHGGRRLEAQFLGQNVANEVVDAVLPRPGKG